MALMALAAQAVGRRAPARRCAAAARRVRRRAVLRRQRDHAGHLGAVARSRAWRSPTPRLEALRAADRRSVVLIGLFLRAAPRHGRRRQAVRADHGGLVRRAGACMGVHQIAADAGDPGGVQSVARAAFPASQPVCIAFVALGRGRAGADRRRGAVRRHGPLRQAADPPRVVRPRAARAGAELPGPGRAADRAIPRRIDNPFFQLFAAVAAVSDGGAGDDGDRDRLAGRDLGRVLDDQQAIQLGFLPRMQRRAHLGQRESARSTCPRDQLAAADRGVAGGGRLRQLRQRWRRPTASR